MFLFERGSKILFMTNFSECAQVEFFFEKFHKIICYCYWWKQTADGYVFIIRLCLSNESLFFRTICSYYNYIFRVFLLFYHHFFSVCYACIISHFFYSIFCWFFLQLFFFNSFSTACIIIVICLSAFSYSSLVFFSKGKKKFLCFHFQFENKREKKFDILFSSHDSVFFFSSKM